MCLVYDILVKIIRHIFDIGVVVFRYKHEGFPALLNAGISACNHPAAEVERSEGEASLAAIERSPSCSHA